MAAVKIWDSHHFGGMPTMDERRISIGDVGLTFDQETFCALAEAMDQRDSTDLKKSQEVYDRYWKKVKQTEAFIKDLREQFYGEGDCLLTLMPMSEIDVEKLEELLDKRARLLGFE